MSEQSESLARTLVCSIPKSGTYLLSALLDQIGLQSTHMHISKSESTFYQNGSRDSYRKSPEEFRVLTPFRDCLERLEPGQFALSHLPCDSETKKASQNLRLLFLHRDLRDCTISLMRFLADTGRDASAASRWIQAEDGPERLERFLGAYVWFFERWAQPLLGWQRQPNALTLSYEALVGDYGEVRQHQALAAVCSHVGVDAACLDFDAIFAEVLNKTTLTWSGDRSRRERYWSPAVEKRFVALGGERLNRQLGYEVQKAPGLLVPVFKKRLGIAWHIRGLGSK